MNFRTLAIGSAFILLPILFVIYKVFFLDTPFLPFKALNTWKYEIELKKSSIKRLENSLSEDLVLPVPPNLESQVVRSFKYTPQNLLTFVRREENQYLSLKKSEALNEDSFKVSATISLGQGVMLPRNQLTKKEQKKYLDLSWVDDATLEEISKLNNSLVSQDDSIRERISKISYFIIDEFVVAPGGVSFSEVVKLFSGESLDQAKLFMALLRLNNIPCRLSFGTFITDASNDKNISHIRTFINEIYFDDTWQYFHPSFTGLNRVSKNFLMIQRNVEQKLEILGMKEIYKINVWPVRSAFYDSKEYFEKVVKNHDVLPVISLYGLPLHLQKAFYVLLLIPLGAFVLCLCRNIIGLQTFGVFTPILLSLFFLETSLFVGFALATLVALAGIALHYKLNKLYLLAVPRLSIMLTFVIIIYVIIALISEKLGFIEKASSVITSFPIVIMTSFTERLVIRLQEEGLKNTLKSLAGTAIVATASYLIFSIEILGMVLFNNPELLLITIGLNIFIGSYTGFRLTEFFRFNDLLQRDAK